MNRPIPNRKLARVKSSFSPSARNTWLGSGFTLVHALPLETAVYCGHEYTQANARFALTVDPTNSALKERAAEIDRLRAGGKATLPTTIGLELSTNPFLRWHDPVIRKNLGMGKAADVEVFAEIRKRKDNF